jgi:hypothetical protein
MREAQSVEHRSPARVAAAQRPSQGPRVHTGERRRVGDRHVRIGEVPLREILRQCVMEATTRAF